MSFQQCVLWNNEGNSDKVWGVTEHHGRPVTFWGKRVGEHLTFKIVSPNEVDKMIATKKRKRGYVEISFDKLEEMEEGFKERFEHMLILCIVSDRFHGIRHRDDENAGV